MIAAPITFNLVGLDGPYKRTKFPVAQSKFSSSLITVGSSRDCDISFGNFSSFESPEHENHVASVHGALLVCGNNRNTKLEYIDFEPQKILGQGYESKINDEEIKSHRPYELNHGDKLTIGDLSFMIKRKRGLFRLLSRLAASIVFS